jgi:hypothetical protein
MCSEETLSYLFAYALKSELVKRFLQAPILDRCFEYGPHLAANTLHLSHLLLILALAFDLVNRLLQSPIHDGKGKSVACLKSCTLCGIGNRNE